MFVPSVDNEGKTLAALCFDAATGRKLWHRPAGKTRRLARNNMASPSPIADAKRVIFLFGNGEMIAFDYDGDQLWRRNLVTDHGRLSAQFGFSSTPLLYNGVVYLPVLHRDFSRGSLERKQFTNSYLLAINPATGKDLWKHVRRTDALAETQDAYTTPVLRKTAERTELILFGADYVTAHDPRNGTELWRWGGGKFNPMMNRAWRVVPTPVVAADAVWVCGPKKQPVYAVGPKGTVHTFETPVTSDACTPLLYRDRLYVLDGDEKVLSCLDPVAGKVLWSGKLTGNGVYRASPTAGDGKIYCISEGGDATVLTAGDKFAKLADISMGGRTCRASIAIADGALFIRTEQILYCIRKPGNAVGR